MDGSIPWGFSAVPRPMVRGSHFIVEPPYARLLRTLGLFDPIEAPTEGAGPRLGAYPVAVRAARTPWADRAPGDADVAASLERLSDDLARDGSRIAATLGEMFDETARWAVGGMLGPLRSAADHIESQLRREYRRGEVPDPGLGSRSCSNGAGTADGWRYYSVETRTLPDGSIETRRVVRGNDGTEKTTVSRRFPDADEDPAA
ncbi:hypothetical protein H4R19_004705 [Coemansia spiralis]|nr:hypothetical protein H4R19_004705 [Coemansia spiralis]